jgi:hypothetical protein
MQPLKSIFAGLVAVILVHCGAQSESDDHASTSAALETCVAEWSPTWQQGSGANEWWVEYKITGASVANAHLEIVSSGAIVPLSFQWNKWVGRSARILRGTPVIVHAETSAGAKAQTRPFAYLDVPAPTTDPCTGSGGGGACSDAWTWSQGSGANEWWVEYAIAGGGTVTSARLEVVGGGSVALAFKWNKWVGHSSVRIVRGTPVIVRATTSAGDTAQTEPFPYLSVLEPETKSCSAPDGGAADGGTTDGGSTDGGVITPNDVYDPNKVLTYELGFDAAALAVLESTVEADRKKWVHGSFKCGDVVFADVGVRRKGSSTFRALPQKAALKIQFARFVPGQSFRGFSELTLNNSMSDPTFIAERLSYHVFRSVGLPAQRAVSALVRINGQPWGLYVNVETPNEQLDDRLFGANANTLYEVNFGSQWLPGVEHGFEEEVGDGSLSDVSALFADVQAAKTATLLTDVAGTLDTTEWLKFSATEAAVGHYDGYAFGVWGSHNYFMAGDVNGRFSLIPWSTDLTMSDRKTVVNANEPQPTGSGAPTLLMRCKQSTACWNAYKAQMKIVLAAYERLGLVELAQRWHAQIDPLVIADPKREQSLSYYNSQSAKLFPWLSARPSVIRSQLGITP